MSNVVSDSSIKSALTAHPSANLEWLALRREEIVEPELPIVDPHHHLWNLPTNRYLLDEALDDFTAGHHITHTVHVQCRSMYRADGEEEMKPVGETEFVNGIAAQSASGEYGQVRVAAGIVGTTDLLLGKQVEPVLDAHMRAAGPRFKGIRPSVVWHADSRVRPLDIPSGILMDSRAREAISCIERRGLSLDLWAFFTQLDEVLDVCRSFPNLTVVVNHLGGPIGIGPYEGRREEVFSEWSTRLRLLSECENVVIKIGGLGMRYAGFRFNEPPLPPSSDALVDSWRMYVHECIDIFGTARYMFESNFPVDRGMFSYNVLWNAFKKLTKNYTPEERNQLFSGTASQTYRLCQSIPRNAVTRVC